MQEPAWQPQQLLCAEWLLRAAARRGAGDGIGGGGASACMSPQGFPRGEPVGEVAVWKEAGVPAAEAGFGGGGGPAVGSGVAKSGLAERTMGKRG